MCAAIGIGQIEVLGNRVEKRRYIYNYYRKNLSSIPFISFVDDIDGYYSNRWLTTILISNKSVINREDIRLELLKNNIESRPLWKPMHLQPIFNYVIHSIMEFQKIFLIEVCVYHLDLIWMK